MRSNIFAKLNSNFNLSWLSINFVSVHPPITNPPTHRASSGGLQLQLQIQLNQLQLLALSLAQLSSSLSVVIVTYSVYPY